MADDIKVGGGSVTLDFPESFVTDGQVAEAGRKKYNCPSFTLSGATILVNEEEVRELGPNDNVRIVFNGK